MSAPVGDETEALRAALDALRDAAEGWPTPNFYTDAADAGEKALARVAGLEAREASLRDALEEACDWLDDDVPEDPADDDLAAGSDEWRRLLDETFVPRASGTDASQGAS